MGSLQLQYQLVAIVKCHGKNGYKLVVHLTVLVMLGLISFYSIYLLLIHIAHLHLNGSAWKKVPHSPKHHQLFFVVMDTVLLKNVQTHFMLTSQIMIQKLHR